MAGGAGGNLLTAGELRERIVFLASTRTDDRGFASETFSTVCTVWAAVRPVGGSNENTQDRRAAKLALEISIRYRSDLTDEMRIVWRGKTFEIVAPLQIVPMEGRMTISALEDESLSLAVDHLTVSPLTAALARGATVQLSATCFNDDGTVIPSIVFWSTSNPLMATVDITTGLVTGVSAGFVTITATCEGVSASAVIDVLPGTVTEFITAFNALGGGTAGMTLDVAWLAGTQQTVAGGFCTQILNAVNPGDGNHLRPSAGNPSGAAVNGSNNLIGKGLYCPGTAPYFAALNYRDDTTTIVSVVNTLPNSLFDDRGAGYSVITIGKICAAKWSWRWGAQGAGNTFGWGGDAVKGPNFEALLDPAANVGGPASPGVGSTLMIADFWGVHTQFGPGNGVLDGNFQRSRYGRDLVQDMGYQIAGAQYTNGRDFFVLENNGIDPSTDTETVGVLIGAGRMNLAQTSLLHDWAAVQSWGASLWKDTRNLGLIFGDSELDPLITVQGDGMDHIGHIVRGGFHGRPQITNCAVVRYARAGNTPDSYQAPFLKWLADCDFVNRAKLVSLQWESNNSALLYPDILTENYTWADLTRSTLGSKCKVIAFSNIYDTDLKKSQYEPAVWNALSANYASHYDGLVASHDGMLYSAFNGGDWTTDPVTGPNAVWWTTRHPKEPDTQEYLETLWHCGIRKGLGDDLSAQSMKVDPSVDHIALTVGGATFTPTWTPRNFDGTALVGKTLAFTSRNTAIASVDASTGVITPAGANGQTGIDCWSNDGAKGTIVVNVSGAPIFLHTFTAADSNTTVPSADTGQATIVQNDGVWGIASNQLKRATAGIGAGHDTVVWDVSQANGTLSVVLAVIEQQMGLVWRDTDVSNCFFCLIDTSGNTLGVYKRVAGVDSQIDHGIVHTWANGDVLGVIPSGNTHQITINGSVVDTITDAFNNTATKIGVNHIGGAISGRWDTLKVV